MRRLIPWLGAAVIITIIFGTMAVVVQTMLRMSVNYSVIERAENAAALLNGGAKPATITAERVSIQNSLSPFVVIYSRSGQPLAGSGYLDGKLPSVPIGVLRAADGQTYHAVTWQPQPRVRISAISVAAQHYYVLGGRSLTEIEKSQSVMHWLVGAGYGASLLALAVTYYVARKQ